ncbi:hypothetical protein ACN9JG_09850 [Cereibacter azotoformans]|uniref:hypothetical protein n=1 Tax=Cereibacter azotoformans TaxID=43057 RepID=UPI003B2175E5
MRRAEIAGFRAESYEILQDKATETSGLSPWINHFAVVQAGLGMRPRIEAVPSVAQAPNERWSTDLCRVWAGRDGWAVSTQ